MQGKTTELEQIVRQKDLEVERLQQQLERRKSSGSSDSSVDVCAAVELDEDPSDAYANEVGVAADMHTRSIYICPSAFHKVTSAVALELSIAQLLDARMAHNWMPLTDLVCRA